MNKRINIVIEMEGDEKCVREQELILFLAVVELVVEQQKEISAHLVTLTSTEYRD